MKAGTGVAQTRSAGKRPGTRPTPPPTSARRPAKPWLRIVAAVAIAGGLAAALALRPGSRAAGTSFEIVAPASGTTVGAPVRLSVALHDATLGRPSAGLDHLHIALDGGQPIADYDATDVTLPAIPAGRHTLTVELAGPDHQPLLPAESVSFTVAR